MAIIIIESPNKIKKIKQITGYEVIATVGHFMDLKEIKIEENYKPVFDYANGKKKSIMNAIEKCKNQDVYIASDPDREGYAIGYMFYQKIKNIAKKIYRAEFHEITPSGIDKGLKSAKLFADTNLNYYQSFLARRISDQLIGFILSPYLKRGLESKENLSAGRVQTPALSLITNREEEINNFNNLPPEDKKEYALQAINQENKIIFKHIVDSKEAKYPKREEIEPIYNEIKDINKALITKIEKTTTKTNPPKPFTTSKMLKAASKKLNMSTKEIQSLAQNLFEKGLITYIRTDSEYISEEFLKEAKDFWEKIYPDTYKYTEYKAGKNSQAEAHEAIRITHPHKYEDIKSICQKEDLNEKHMALYEIIFKNTLLSQQNPAEYEKLNVFSKIKLTDFKTSFKKVTSKGFLGIFDEKEESDEEECLLESFNFKEGDSINIDEISIKEIDKKPPKRYLEADFIEVMEKAGIGRPSTYATFLPILLNKEYITISNDKKREVIPTKLGMGVINFFKKDKNNWILDLNYTKEMEDNLDKIANGNKQYLEYMKQTHAKMDFMPLKSENKEKKDYPASEAQIKFCKSIAEKLNISLPDGYEKDYRIASKFINDNKNKLNKKS